MDSSKPIRHAAYETHTVLRLSLNSVAHGAALVAAFLFVTAVVCGVL